MKRFFLVLILLCGAGVAGAQSVTVTASHLGGSQPLTGIVTFQPTLANGTPASFRLPGGGQSITTPFTVYAQKGAFSISLPDTTLTAPQNICFRVTAQLTGQQVLGPGYQCVQPHATAVNSGDWCQAGVCNFDNYIPNLTPLPVQYAPAIVQQTQLTDAATITLSAAALKSTFAIALNAGIPYRTLNATGLVNGNSFSVLITPDSTASDPMGLGFGSGCNWQADPASGLGSLANGLVFAPGSTAQVILAVTYDGTNCNVTEVQ